MRGADIQARVPHQIGPPYWPSPEAQLTHPILTSALSCWWPARMAMGTRQMEVVPALSTVAALL